MPVGYGLARGVPDPEAWIGAGVSFTVGDITILLKGVPQSIEYASQVLQTFSISPRRTITMRLKCPTR